MERPVSIVRPVFVIRELTRLCSHHDIVPDLRHHDTVYLRQPVAQSSLLYLCLRPASRGRSHDRHCRKFDASLRTFSLANTQPQTSNTKKPDPEPTLAVQACEFCERAVLKTAVPGFTAGQECHGCQPSASTSGVDPVVTGAETLTETMTLSDVETVSLGSYPVASGTGADDGDPEALGTPTSPAAYSGPTGNTPYGPASALPTYITAGSSRSFAPAGVIGSVLVVLGALVW